MLTLYKNIKLTYLSMSLCLLCFMALGNAFAVVITMEDKDKYLSIHQLSDSDLRLMMNSQYGKVINRDLMTFNIPVALTKDIKDMDALKFIAKLLMQNDPRASLAIANYIQRYPSDLYGYYLAATELVKQQKYTDAKLALSKILTEQNGFSQAHTLMGLIEFSQQQFEAGISHFRTAIVQEHPDPRAFKYLIWSALVNNNLDEATGYAEQLHSLQDPKLLTRGTLELAELYRLTENYTAIESVLKPIIDNAPQSIKGNNAYLEAMTRLLEALTIQGKSEEAQTVLAKLKDTKAYALYPTVISRSRLLNQQGQHQQAIELLEKQKDLPVKLEQIRLIELAKSYALLNHPQKLNNAIAQYKATLGNDVSVDALSPLVELMLQTGKSRELINYIESELKTSPNSDPLRLQLVDLYIAAGDLAAASNLLNKLVKESPDLAPAYYRRGILLFNNMQNQEARAEFEKAVELSPQNVDYWLALVGAMHDHREHSHATGMAATDHESVLPVFERAIKANPNSAILRYEKGLTAYSGSQLSLALEDFSKALEVSPYDVSAMAMKAITLADLNQNLNTAMDLISQAESLTNNNPAILDAKGWILTQQGELKKGAEYLQQALREMPDDEAVLAHLSFNNRKAGNNDTAIDFALLALTGTLPDHSTSSLRELIDELDPRSSLTFPVHKISNFGVGEQIGEITITETPAGVKLSASLTDLPAGLNGMHFHEKPTCDAGMKDGQLTAGLAAGGHYGHDMMNMDMSQMDMSSMTPEQHAQHMKMMKPKGDLPPLSINENGKVLTPVEGKDLTISELRGRSLMIHRGPDNDGKSGPKIACMVIR